MSAQFLSGALTLIACFMILCRVDKMMNGVTQGTVFAQHAILGMALFGSFVISFTDYAEWGDAILSAGIVCFLLLSVRRWKRGAPIGTTKPMGLDETELRHVSGGKKDT